MTKKTTILVSGIAAIVVIGLSVFSFLIKQGTVSPVEDTRDDIVDTYTPPAPTSTPPVLDNASTTSQIPKGRLRLVRDPVVLPGEHFVKVPVLMYHYIRPMEPKFDAASRWLSVSPEHFRAQMQEIADLGYHTITPDELASAVAGGASLPEKPVLITFDDGYRDQYTEAFPILKELHLNATFFIVSDYISSSTSVYVSRDMVREMDASGVATIAAHTRHHAALVKATPAARRDEIFGSKKDLEDLLKHPLTAFAYPYGNFNDDVRALVKEAGFSTAFSTLLGSVHTPSSVLALRRIRVLDDEHLGPILKKFGE